VDDSEPELLCIFFVACGTAAIANGEIVLLASLSAVASTIKSWSNASGTEKPDKSWSEFLSPSSSPIKSGETGASINLLEHF
jgi:hypothetical protein